MNMAVVSAFRNKIVVYHHHQACRSFGILKNRKTEMFSLALQNAGGADAERESNNY